MLSLNGRDVLLVRLHVPTHVAGIGNVGPAVDKNSGKILGSAVITRVDGGVLFQARGVEAFFPDSNIVSMQLAPESK